MKQSAGILPYRFNKGALEVFLVHPGGPFWVNKDEGAWSIAKGEYNENEEPLEEAIREFKEETGVALKGPFMALRSIRQKSGKIVHAFATEQDIDSSKTSSNSFTLEWPPGSGSRKTYPEVDKAAWFSPAVAKQKILAAQAVLIDDLMEKLGKRVESYEL